MKAKSKGRWKLLAAVVLIGSALDLGLLVSTAHAIVGRPLTPMSYAGVARRTTRRTVYAGAAMGAAYSPYYSPYYW